MKRPLTPLLLLIFLPTALADQGEVPFGDKINPTVINYNRTTPVIATAGELREGAIPHLAGLGFNSIVDIRTPAEGVDKERVKAREHGLKYLNIPVGKEPPSPDQLDQFERWINEPGNLPVIVHCASANRVGTLWAMYRLREGVSLDEALNEGRTIGMKESRESQVRDFARELTE